MSYEYRIILDPALSITVAELSEAWAEIPECTAAGKLATGAEAAGQKTFAVDAASMAMGALIATSAGLAKDLIVILVKRALERADKRAASADSERVKVTTTRDPKTGLPIIQVTREEP